MDTETFCDRWFGLDELEPEEREQRKQERGYRARCVRILSAVLNGSSPLGELPANPSEVMSVLVRYILRK